MRIGLGSGEMAFYSRIFRRAFYSRIFRRDVEPLPDESELFHTFKCKCEVQWHEKDTVAKPCWACGTLVTPECNH